MPWFSVTRPAARALRVLTAGAALAAGTAAGAQPVTLTFDGLTPVDASGIRTVDNCYVEGGVRVAIAGMPCGAPDVLASWTPDNPLYYTGTPSLLNYGDGFGAPVDFSMMSGSPFSLHSASLAPFLGQLGEPTTVLFTGFLPGGGTVTRSVSIPGGDFPNPLALTDVTFTGFDALSSLRVEVTDPAFSPLVQLDNVALAAVPEPTTVLLVGGGLVALGALARRRRLAPSATPAAR
jgi:hypothetical protein